ncbi:EAL domain-containing protein [Ruminococcus sp. NK3A76]|uniref:EAL domain-containing protein n=1 Tax=Ruminococcus sp. NK3A76 TaxID=877411 RepID=UPI00048BADDC|nr:EAL domain-containing protein [Ruminococcus sp. NK3A76]
MFGKDAILWKKYFGLAWNEMMELAPEVGRYAIFKDSATFCLDANAKRLMGFENEPSYDMILSLIKRLKGDTSAHIAVKQLFEDSATAIGFIYEKNDLSGSNTLSLCTLNRLITTMSQTDSFSLLALIQLEEKSGRHALSDMHIYEILTVIVENVPKDSLISSLGQGKLWLYIPDFKGDEILYLTEIKKKIEAYPVTSLGKDGDGRVTFSAGCAASLSSPVQRMNTAKFTLFEAAARGLGTILAYSVDRYEDKKNEFARIEQFSNLIDSNLFRYHFQPIISAHTGEIIAYELLMRSGGGVEMYPLEILDYAKKYDRLYDIEKATFFNALHIVSENQQQFSSKKLFINSISDHILTKTDWDRLLSDYGELLEKVVIELTEQSEISDEQLDTVKNRIAFSNMELAIDDYGTGYSNTSNLLRYNPSYVKIDRQLIAGIDGNLKMQKLVSSIIEYVHSNGFAALAEGVETYSELKTMIGLGCDLIQGFYISKPKPFILYEVSDSIRDEIIKINLEFSDNIDKIYHPKNCETVDLIKITQEHYTVIFVETPQVIIEGNGRHACNINVIVKDGLECTVTLRGAFFTTDKENPLISIGSQSKVTLNIEGRNELNSKGIHVPASADLTIAGDGTLYIKTEQASAYAIGTDRYSSHGNITVLLDGHISLEANGDNSVGIGGGMNEENKTIRILSGNLNVSCSGGTCVGIGAHEGPSRIEMSDCSASVEISSAVCTGVGTLEGDADIDLENIALSTNLTGMTLCGVGSANAGTGSAELRNGRIDMMLCGRTINCLGTRNGNMDIDISHAAIKFYCEGGSISGIGDSEGDGNVHISESEVSLEFRTGDGFGLGSKNGKLDIINCRKDVRINE